jgi:hypothetical protein
MNSPPLTTYTPNYIKVEQPEYGTRENILITYNGKIVFTLMRINDYPI